MSRSNSENDVFARKKGSSGDPARRKWAAQGSTVARENSRIGCWYGNRGKQGMLAQEEKHHRERKGTVMRGNRPSEHLAEVARGGL